MSTMTTGDISFRTSGTIAAELLKRAAPALVMQPFLQTKPIPKNASETIKFRRYDSLPPATTSLTEGVTPSGSSVVPHDYYATLVQIGDWVGITDVVADTHEDPIIMEFRDILAQQAAETVETKLFYIMRAGTNVYYANGSARTDVNNTFSLGLQRKITRGFKRQNAKQITSRLSSSANMDTVSVKPAFIAFIHPDLEPVIQDTKGFKDVVDYGQVSPYPTEIGSIGDVRYLTSTIFEKWSDA